MNDLVVFTNNQFGEVRGIEINGEPWLVGKDVAESLRYSNPNEAIADHVDDEDKLNSKSLSSFELNLGQRGGWLINESGFYSLVFSSKLPKAKEFKHWVTAEVLPSIRKTGSYSLTQKQDSYLIEDPIARAERWIEEQKEKRLLETKIEQDKPLVDFVNQVADTSDLIDMAALSKLLKDEHIDIGRNRLFQWLRDNNYLRDNNEPYQRYVEQGIFQLREYTFETPYGSKTGCKTYVTGKGQIYITEKLRAEFKK